MAVVKRKKRKRVMGIKERGFETRLIRRDAAAEEEGAAVDMKRM